ncbi:hypothetical protein LC20_06760 [Yersinia hibernica]|uniref:Lipoprotein n=2 Tax=Yersinia TaxID=629 RepID=A0A7U5PGI4_YEREN|nr:hypothetical protein LC20_06760 [Yersinia hibernica]
MFMLKLVLHMAIGACALSYGNRALTLVDTYRGGKPSVASPNYLERQFVVPTPNTHWVSDMIYISEATGERRFSIIDERYKTGG